VSHKGLYSSIPASGAEGAFYPCSVLEHCFESPLGLLPSAVNIALQVCVVLVQGPLLFFSPLRNVRK
jgi:hypothetical protein